MSDKVRKELLAQFDVDKKVALEDVITAAHGTKSQNYAHRDRANQDVSDFTSGQLAVLTKFGELYDFSRLGLDINTALMAATNGKIIGAEGTSSPVIGLRYHCPKFIFTEEKLTEHGYALVDILAEAVKGYISQYEASAIMSCVGFNTNPGNPVRDDFEKHLSGKKGYTPGIYREIMTKTPTSPSAKDTGPTKDPSRETGWGDSTK